MKKLLALFTLTALLAGCGGGGSDAPVTEVETNAAVTYNSAASKGEHLEYKIDETKLTYSYEIKSSAFGLEGSTGSGTLTKNSDGTYTPSTAPNAKVLMLPNKVLIGATTLHINGVDEFTLIAGVPKVDNVQFSDIAGTYNYVGLQCLSANCANYTSLYGTYNIDTDGNWVECTYSDYTASPNNCSNRNSGALNSLGDGKFQITSGDSNLGTGMFYYSPTGQKIMVIDLQDYFGDYGRGMLFGAPQKVAEFGSKTNGTWHWNTTLDNSGSFLLSGAVVTSSNPEVEPITLTANVPWNGFADTGEGYAILADEGIYMWVPKTDTTVTRATMMVVGVKK